MYLLAALVTVLAVSNVDAGCCVAPQFTAKQGFLVGYARGFATRYYTMSADIAYDKTNLRISAKSTIYRHGRVKKVHVISCYKCMKSYLITDNRCTVANLHSNFTELCVPDNAESVQNLTLGLEDHHLDVETYMITRHNVQAFISIHHDERHCVPVSGAYVYSPSRRFASMTTFSVGDIELGIKDNSVFNIPSFCRKVPSSEHEPFTATLLGL